MNLEEIDKFAQLGVRAFKTLAKQEEAKGKSRGQAETDAMDFIDDHVRTVTTNHLEEEKRDRQARGSE